MSAVDRHMTPHVEVIVVGTTSPELLQVLPWSGKHVGPEAVKTFFRQQLGPNTEVLDFGTDELIEQDASLSKSRVGPREAPGVHDSPLERTQGSQARASCDPDCSPVSIRLRKLAASASYAARVKLTRSLAGSSRNRR